MLQLPMVDDILGYGSGDLTDVSASNISMTVRGRGLVWGVGRHIGAWEGILGRGKAYWGVGRHVSMALSGQWAGAMSFVCVAQPSECNNTPIDLRYTVYLYLRYMRHVSSDTTAVSS
jgi:hypothetical protein